MKPSSTKHHSRSGKVMLAVLGAFLVIGSLVVFALFGHTVFQASKAGDWVSHPCTIDSTVIKVSRSSKGRVTRNTQATYSWQWEGKTYHSQRYSFTSDTVNSSDDEARDLSLAARMPNGYKCWVNPHNPQEAVLSRDAPWFVMMMLVPFVAFFPLVGVGLMLSGRTARERREMQAKASWPAEPLHWREDWSQGRVQEKSLWFSPGGRWMPVWVIFVFAAAFAGLFVTSSWTTGRQIVAVLMGTILAATIVMTVRKVRSAARFGRLEFLPDALPMHPGLPLTGQVPLRNPLRRTSGVQASIQVTRTVNGRRGSRTEKVISAEVRIQVEPQAIFMIGVLPQAPPFFPVDPAESIAWTLTLKAPGNGINATFELPVQAQSQRPVSSGQDHGVRPGPSYVSC